MRDERRVVIPDALVRQPAGLGGDVFLRRGLHQGHVTAHHGIGRIEQQSWINGVRQRPLGDLRLRPLALVGGLPSLVLLHQHGQVVEPRRMPPHLARHCRPQRGAEFGIELRDRLVAGRLQPRGSFGDGLQSGQGPERVGELGPQAAQAAVAESARQQAVAPIGAVFVFALVAHVAQEPRGAQDLGPHFHEIREVLREFALANQREHRDAGVFPMLRAAAREDAAVCPLACPGGLQTLLRFGVVAQIARRFQNEMAVDDPQAAVDRGTDLEREAAVFHFASLQNVAGAGAQKFAVAARQLPGHRAAESAPTPPVRAGLVEQSLRRSQPVAKALGGLPLLWQAHKAA